MLRKLDWKRLDLARLDWPRGLRAGVALCVPLIAADVTGFAALGWAALGGFEAVISDAGGPYRSRMARLGVLSLGGGFACALGTLVGGDLRWALPVTAAFCFLWTYLSVLGQPFTSAGLLVQVIYICGVGEPSRNWREALLRGGMLLGGGLWAIALSLWLWPFAPFRPARNAVSECYQALGNFLESMIELHGREQARPALWHRLARHHQYRIRNQLEAGWLAVASVRAVTRAETVQSSYLVVLLETADMLLAQSVALAEHLEAGHGTDEISSFELARWPSMQSAEKWVARVLRGQERITAAESLGRRAELARLATARIGGQTHGDFVAAQLAECFSLLETAVECASAVRLGESANILLAATGAHVWARLGKLREGLPLARLRTNLRRDSLFLRHAARVALVCSVDVVLIHALHTDHGYWLMMTSLIVLQPYVSGTIRRGLERTGGTVAGGILAAALAITLHSTLTTAFVLFPLAVLCLAFLATNYAVYAFFLTPTFVLAYLPHPGDWQLALTRVANTALGAIIALLAMRFLFPSYERNRLGGYLLASLEANRRYLETLRASWQNQDPATRRLAQARRATGLAHNATEESVERVFAESWRQAGSGAEAALAVSAYLRRFAQSITTLTTLKEHGPWAQDGTVQLRLARLEAGLTQLETQLRCDSPEDVRENVAAGDRRATDAEESVQAAEASNELGERQLARLERQFAVLNRKLSVVRQHPWAQCS